jgi:hypothetical protein|tara:strand:+ start:234 stop:692 length:459 start_codon:yes stop_codon:yes gene_type:complete
MKDLILINDNSISKSDCDYLIELFKTNGPTHDWLDYQVMTIHPLLDQKAHDIVMKVASKFRFGDINWCEIAKRPPGIGHPEHIDDAAGTGCASVTYLNDNFTGGETYFVDDMAVRPKTGRTIYFDGVYREHGVHTVKDSARYTLAIWYKKID